MNKNKNFINHIVLPSVLLIVIGICFALFFGKTDSDRVKILESQGYTNVVIHAKMDGVCDPGREGYYFSSSSKLGIETIKVACFK